MSTFTATPEQLEQAGLVADTRKAMLLSPYFEILEILGKGIERSRYNHNFWTIRESDLVTIKNLCHAALEAALSRKEPKGNDKSRYELIAALCQMQAPAPIGTYPSASDIDDFQSYSVAVAEATQRHLKEINRDIPPAASDQFDTVLTDALHDYVDVWDMARRWCEDRNENREDIRADMRRYMQAAE